MHIRQEIREAIASILVADTTYWNHVFEQRTPPTRDVNPFLLVYVDSENSEVETLNSPFNLMREINLIIQGYVRRQDSEAIEDKLDNIAMQVETLLTTATLNAELSRRVVSVYLAGSDFALETGDNDREYAVISMGFVINYQTVEGLPSV